MNGSIKVHQGILEKVVKKLFPKEEFISNVRKEANIPGTHDNYLELDIWLPRLHICFEFQDPYHYIERWDSRLPVLERKEMDHVKRELVVNRRLTLVAVPCWWDGSSESVAAEIRFQRPDLLVYGEDYADDVIPLNPDSDYFTKRVEGELWDIGDLMLASFPEGIQFTASISPDKPWWVGEKYDGCRACWNPKKRVLLSRSGNVIRVPATMISKFENFKNFLDGEIWLGRGDPIDAIRLSLEDGSINWALVRFVAFDNPGPITQRTAFEKRYSSVLSAVPADHPFLVIAQRFLCVNGKQLIKLTQELIEEGGEGVILRRPNSFYTRGRSRNLVKFKASREDKEALVVELKGGFCLLQLPDLSTFSVPIDSISCKMPKSGDIVSFSFQSYSPKAIPVKPEIFRIRPEFTWEAVVREYEKEMSENEKVFSKSLNEVTKKSFGKPSGYWNDEAGKKKMRKIVEDYAKNELKIDPLIPANWYVQKRSEVILNTEVNKVLHKHAGSLVRTLKNLFPELSWDASKFHFIPQKYWASLENRRQFMLRLAKHNGFDPLVAENWYNLSQEKILEYRGGRSVLTYYGNSPVMPVFHLFPDIGLDISKFNSVPKQYWSDVNNRRKFFEQIARKRGFDPLVAENWYSISNSYFISIKSSSSIFAYYNGNFAEALIKLFPNVKFDITRFMNRKYQWADSGKAKKFFMNFAAKNGFNPSIVSSWYSVTKEQILAEQGGEEVLRPYEGSHSKALVHLFPDIGLEEAKFEFYPDEHWENPKNRRKFFEELATRKSMDPLLPSTWYTFPLYTAKFRKNSAKVMAYHKKSAIVAIIELFPDLKLERSKFEQVKYVD